MRDYFEKEICTNCCIDKQFCERCGVRKKTANPEKEKPALMARLQESDKNCDGNCKNCVAICGTTQNTIFLEAADAIEELLATVPRWISVEDELPSRYETVLLNIQTCKDSYVTIGDYEPNELRFRDFADRNNQVYCGDIVTHWMPLPEPPKEVQDG